MKTILNLVLASALLIMSGTLLAVSLNDSSNVTIDQQATVEETSFSREDAKIAAKANKTLHMSVLALDNIMENPENSIPPSLISKSEGIVIFPSAFKLALGVAGGQGARGIAMIRKEDGSWSNPFFVSLGEGSLGFQIGAQSSDIVLLFKDKNDIIGIDKAEITLGSDVGVAAGPVSKGSSSSTDIKFDSEIYSYYQSKGLFAGVSLKGGVLAFNNRVSEALYCMDNVNADDIFNEIETPYNDQVNDLIETIDMYGE